jgi:hypothetical protein
MKTTYVFAIAILLYSEILACGKADKTAEPTPEATDTPQAVEHIAAVATATPTATATATPKPTATTLPTNEWYDAKTNFIWRYGATMLQTPALATCTGVWTKPNYWDIQTACSNGLFDAYVSQMGALPASYIWATSGNIGVSATCMEVGGLNPAVVQISACINRTP